eukprot:605205-Amphidinium_carterae.1
MQQSFTLAFADPFPCAFCPAWLASRRRSLAGASLCTTIPASRAFFAARHVLGVTGHYDTRSLTIPSPDPQISGFGRCGYR